MSQSMKRSLSGSSARKPEVSSHQLIYYICLLLFMAVICFMCGILLGRAQANKEYKAKLADTSTSPENTKPEPLSSGPATATPAASGLSSSPHARPVATLPTGGEGRQTAPKQVVLPTSKPTSADVKSPAEAPLPPKGATLATPASATPAPAAPATPVAATPAPATPATPAAAAPPAATTPAAPATPAATPAAQPAAPAATPVAPATPPPATPPPAPAPVAEPVPAQPPATVAKAAPADSEVVPLPSSDSVAAPKKAIPSGSASGKYGVQVASFPGADRDKKAAGCVSKLESLGLKSIVRTSEDGKYVRVFAGAYADRATADSACKALRAYPEFKDCFVKPL